MQHYSLIRVAAIKFIPQYGKATKAQMHTNLMGAPRKKISFHQKSLNSIHGKIFQNSKLCPGIKATLIFWHNTPFCRLTFWRNAIHLLFNSPLITLGKVFLLLQAAFLRSSRTQSNIALCKIMTFKHFLNGSINRPLFCKKDCSACFPVQPVHDSCIRGLP